MHSPVGPGRSQPLSWGSIPAHSMEHGSPSWGVAGQGDTDLSFASEIPHRLLSHPDSHCLEPSEGIKKEPSSPVCIHPGDRARLPQMDTAALLPRRVLWVVLRVAPNIEVCTGLLPCCLWLGSPMGAGHTGLPSPPPPGLVPDAQDTEVVLAVEAPPTRLLCLPSKSFFFLSHWLTPLSRIAPQWRT